MFSAYLYCRGHEMDTGHSRDWTARELGGESAAESRKVDANVLTIQCCSCKRVCDHGVWHSPERLPSCPVSHTYCPLCLAEIQRVLRESKTLAAGDAGGAAKRSSTHGRQVLR